MNDKEEVYSESELKRGKEGWGATAGRGLIPLLDLFIEEQVAEGIQVQGMIEILVNINL